ncbi:unnamed protein product, partial [Medioppia subpectinata]
IGTFIKTIGASAIIGLVVYYIARFYAKRYNYPPGPIPLPLIGNVLMFRNYTTHWNEEILKLSKIYGPVFTLWIGPLPFVFICDLDLGREAFNKIEFTGRPASQLGSIFSNEQHRAVVFDDYGHSWESLRRISHTTIRKYAKTKALSEVVAENVSEIIDKIVATEGIGKPFRPKLYVYNIFDIEQPELKKFKYITSDFQTDLGNTLFLYEFIPVMRYFMANPLIKYKQYFDEMMKYSRNIYQTHDKTYDSKNLRDFCDILIAAKHESIAEDKQTAPYFTDDNLPAVLIELFMAGTETTHATFQWLLLFMAYKPEYQDKLSAEINREIGDRVPVVEDKSRLNYTLAFISEILRHKNPFPIGVFHKALVNSKIGGYPVAQNTQVVLHQQAIMKDAKHWKNPDKFEPERFLDENGQFIQTKPVAYMPFSYGRRICPGESLAINDLFLVLALVRFIQLTSDYRIELHSEHGDPTPDVLEPDLIKLK